MKSLAESIAGNRARQHRYERAERILRRIRLRIFDYEDHDVAFGTHQAAKARRLMIRCQRILAPLWRAQRAAAEDRKLQATPSAFEPGCR